MKNQLKHAVITAIIIVLNINFSVNAQDMTRHIKENTDLFHGRWIAYDGAMSYEVEFVRNTFPHYEAGKFMGNIEGIWGKLIYRQNNEKIRETPEISLSAAIYDFQIISPSQIYFYFSDRERTVMGGFDFIIDSNNPKKAQWKWGKKRNGLRSNEYDMPDGLTFTKIE